MIYRYESLDSTNEEAKRMVAAADGGAPFGAVVIARRQTAGKGRRGRAFFSPEGDSLYASFVLPPGSHEFATVAAAVAVCRAIEAVRPGAGPRVKWVNDVLVDGRKVCGILAEGVGGADGLAAVVLGIGVNIGLREADFPPELRGVAGALDFSPAERDAFEDALIREVFSIGGCGEEAARSAEGQAGLDRMAVLEAYRGLSALNAGDPVAVFRAGTDEATAATVVGIADDGGLAVCYSDGRREVLRSGEVSVRAKIV